MASEDFPAPSEGFVVTHFIVAADVARSRDFYTCYMRDPDGHLIEVGQTTEVPTWAKGVMFIRQR
jgi:hypothetical protein